MLLGLMDSFRDRGQRVQWEVFSYYPERDAEIAAGLPDVRVHPGHPVDLFFFLLPNLLLLSIGIRTKGRFGRAAQAVTQCDGALLMGGTTFADSMLHKVPWNVLAALPAWWARRPILFLSQTFGPFTKLLNRWPAQWILRRAREVHGRGRTSAEYVAALSVAGTRYEPDLSFAMDVPAFASIAEQHVSLRRFNKLRETSGRRPIGLAPNTIVWNRCRKQGFDYPAFLANALEAIDAAGYLPVLIPHSFRSGSKQHHNNDKHLCELVLTKMPADIQCVFIDEDLDARELRSLIGEMHLLIASRFHAMVSALSRGVPPVSIGWGAHKYSEVLAEFDVEDLYYSFRDLDAANLPALLGDTLARRDEFKARIDARLPAIVGQARSVAERISNTLQAR